MTNERIAAIESKVKALRIQCFTAGAAEARHDVAAYMRHSALADAAQDELLAALTHGAHADTARLEAEPNYEAGVKAYHETVMYWAPELLSSPEHIAQLVERIVDAATRSTQEGNQV